MIRYYNFDATVRTPYHRVSNWKVGKWGAGIGGAAGLAGNLSGLTQKGMGHLAEKGGLGKAIAESLPSRLAQADGPLGAVLGTGVGATVGTVASVGINAATNAAARRAYLIKNGNEKDPFHVKPKIDVAANEHLTNKQLIEKNKLLNQGFEEEGIDQYVNTLRG